MKLALLIVIVVSCTAIAFFVGYALAKKRIEKRVKSTGILNIQNDLYRVYFFRSLDECSDVPDVILEAERKG